MLMKTGAALEPRTRSTILVIERIHSDRGADHNRNRPESPADSGTADEAVAHVVPFGSPVPRPDDQSPVGWSDGRILIVDDCTLYRENLVAILAADGMGNACVAWDFLSLMSAFRANSPDVVLLSTTTRDSTDLLREILQVSPGAKVIVMGLAEDDEAGILGCAAAGAVGFHLKTDSLDELLALLRRIPAGESFLPPRVTKMLLHRLSTGRSSRQRLVRELVLTTREAQILRMLRMGLSNRDISVQLSIAIPTVKNHVHSVLAKLGVRSRAEAAAFSPGVGPYPDE